METIKKTKSEHTDIIFLRMRMQYLIENERYESCVVIKRWIDELTVYYNDRDRKI